MKNVIGKKNILFGLVYFLATLGAGLFLANKGQAGDPAWAESTTKKLLAVAHSHGNLESLLNIVFGYLICRLADPGLGLAKVGSVLLIAGAALDHFQGLRGAWRRSGERGRARRRPSRAAPSAGDARQPAADRWRCRRH